MINILLTSVGRRGYLVDYFKQELRGVRGITGSPQTVGVRNDKWRSCQFLRRNGLDTPRTFCGMEECMAALASGEAAFPLIVKPRWGMGAIGVYSADNPAEPAVFYRKVRREIFSS